MGGCCGTSRRPNLQWPQDLEEHELLASDQDSADVADSDENQLPPVHFTTVMGSSASTQAESAQTHARMDSEVEDGIGLELAYSTEADSEAADEEDVCPICLEGYNTQNPLTITKCNHHFHLPCICRWLEINDTCPFCNQYIDFEVLH